MGTAAGGTGGVAGVAASGLSMAVAHLIGLDPEANSTGLVGAEELRAAQASLLCTTSEAAVLALVDVMGLKAKDDFIHSKLQFILPELARLSELGLEMLLDRGGPPSGERAAPPKAETRAEMGASATTLERK